MTSRTTKKEITAYAVSLIMKAALLAAAWERKSRKRGLKSIAKCPLMRKTRKSSSSVIESINWKPVSRFFKNISLHHPANPVTQ